MFSKVSALIRFNDLTKRKFPHCTKTYWLRKHLVDEVVAWAEETKVNGIYLVETTIGSDKITEKTDLTSAFAFTSEEDLSMFILVFYGKIIKCQEQTSIYKVFKIINEKLL